MIVLTVGTNTWVTLAEADSYFESRYGSDAWATLTADNRKKLLISAYQWINSDPAYSISAVTDKLKKAQLELAWYIYTNYEQHEKHVNLYSSGVRTFRISKFHEDLEKPQMPTIVKDLLDEYNFNSGGYFPTISREVDPNG